MMGVMGKMGISGDNGEIPKLSIFPKFPIFPIFPILPTVPICDSKQGAALNIPHPESSGYPYNYPSVKGRIGANVDISTYNIILDVQKKEKYS